MYSTTRYFNIITSRQLIISAKVTYVFYLLVTSSGVTRLITFTTSLLVTSSTIGFNTPLSNTTLFITQLLNTIRFIISLPFHTEYSEQTGITLYLYSGFRFLLLLSYYIVLVTGFY